MKDQPTSRSISESLIDGIKDMTEVMHPGSTNTEDKLGIAYGGQKKRYGSTSPNHTPGEWRFDIPESVENKRRIVSLYQHTGKVKTTKLICVVENETDGKYIITAVNEYDKLKADNARVLEALKSAIPYLSDGHGCNGMGTKSKAEAAIAQAENGGSNGL